MMKMRYLLGKTFGWDWDSYKHTQAHYIRGILMSIQKDKKTFNMGNPRGSFERMKSRGFI